MIHRAGWVSSASSAFLTVRLEYAVSCSMIPNLHVRANGLSGLLVGSCLRCDLGHAFLG